jgi:hypothetical protein
VRKRFNHRQVLYQLRYSVDRDRTDTLRAIEAHTGRPTARSKLPIAMQPQRLNTVGHAATDFLLRTEVRMPDEEKLVFDGLFRHLHAGDKGVNKEGWAFIDGHWKDPRLRAAMIWEAEHQE